jgi:hypothetical protein
VALPGGLQVWLAGYLRVRHTEAYSYVDELQVPGGDHIVMVITYVVDSFVFQLTLPRLRDTSHDWPHGPLFQTIGDFRAVAIWPDVFNASWPPRKQLDPGTLQDFRERFRRVLVRRS